MVAMAIKNLSQSSIVATYGNDWSLSSALVGMEWHSKICIRWPVLGILARFSSVRFEINLCYSGQTPLTRAPRERQGPSIVYGLPSPSRSALGPTVFKRHLRPPYGLGYCVTDPHLSP